MMPLLSLPGLRLVSSSCSWPRPWPGAPARKMAGLGVVVQVQMSAIKPPSLSLKVKYLQLLPAVERQPGLRMEFPLLRPRYGALAARFWRPAATPARP